MTFLCFHTSAKSGLSTRITELDKSLIAFINMKMKAFDYFELFCELFWYDWVVSFESLTP